MTLLNFENSLREKLKHYDKPRPFICDGNPLDCKVFIVGINAATEMENNFWSFWDEGYGFKNDEWFETYILERRTKPLKPNRTRRNKISNTRQRIEWITTALSPIKTLETNLFVKATTTARELTKEDRDSSIFEFLVDVIKPEIIFLHGSVVLKHFKKLYKIDIEKDKIKSVEIRGVKTKVSATMHLAIGWSKQKSIELGEKLKFEIEG